MVDLVRVTQQYLESVNTDGAAKKVRVTQQYLESVNTDGAAKKVRVTQQHLESINTDGAAKKVRLTQQYVEAVYVLGTDDRLIVTHQYGELLANNGNAAAARVTNQYIEVITTKGITGLNDGLRATQQYVEAIGAPSGDGNFTITHQFAEALLVNAIGDIRATHQFSEIITGQDFTSPTSTGDKRRFTHAYAEVLSNTSQSGACRATQQYAEIFFNSSQNVNFKTTHQFAEVILKKVFTTTPINDKDVFLKAESTRIQSVRLRSELNISGDLSGTILDIPVADVIANISLGSTGQSTIDILENSGTAITMTAAQLFRTGTGTAGLFIGAGGLFSIDDAGNTIFSIDGVTGAPEFSGNITGGGNIDINGIAKFNGSTTSVGLADINTSAIWGNESCNSRIGIAAQGHDLGSGIFGVGAFGFGCPGEDSEGVRGVSGNNNRPGVSAVAVNAGDEWALNVEGKMTISSNVRVDNLNAQEWEGMTTPGNTANGATTTTQNLTNKPGTSTTSNTWLELTAKNGVTYVLTAWKKDV